MSMWVISRHSGTLWSCPLYPQERTNSEAVGLSAKCHVGRRPRCKGKIGHFSEAFAKCTAEKYAYSITSSARASNVGGTLRPE